MENLLIFSCVTQCDSIYSCVTQCDSIFFCVTQCDSIFSCVTQCDSIFSCVTQCDSIFSCATQCDSIFSCVTQCDAIFSCIMQCDREKVTGGNRATFITSPPELLALRASFAHFSNHGDSLFWSLCTIFFVQVRNAKQQNA
jgi:hypothetical protein